MTMIQVTQTKGLAQKPEKQRLTLRGLGLRRIGHTVVLKDTPAIRGMVEKVQHLVEVKVLEGDAKPFGGRHKNPDGSSRK